MQQEIEFEPAATDVSDQPVKKKSQRRGQHRVLAVVRTYSDEADWAIRKMMSAPRHSASSAVYLSGPKVDDADVLTGKVVRVPFRLWYLEWMPRPSKNEWNTESDFRQNLYSYLGERWYDIVTVKYEWRPLP